MIGVANLDDPNSKKQNPFFPTIARLSSRASGVLDGVLEGMRRVALVDFPNHGNVGDSAIWLGEVAYLQWRGKEIVYAGDARSFSLAALRKAKNLDAILIHGGGNLGDLFPHHQEFRELILSKFTDLPVVQLPQTLHFQSSDALDRFRRAVEAHGNFTLLVRDEESRRLATAALSCPIALCPDSAFLMGDQSNLRFSPCAEIVLLARSDRERRGERLSAAIFPAGLHVEAVDWLDEAAALNCAREVAPSALKVLTTLTRATHSMAVELANSAARHAFLRGCRILSDGKIVVTDRLHGHILCLLLGIPHLVIDSGYGKLSRFMTTWETSGAQSRMVEKDQCDSILSQWTAATNV